MLFEVKRGFLDLQSFYWTALAAEDEEETESLKAPSNKSDYIRSYIESGLDKEEIISHLTNLYKDEVGEERAQGKARKRFSGYKSHYGPKGKGKGGPNREVDKRMGTIIPFTKDKPDAGVEPRIENNDIGQNYW